MITNTELVLYSVLNYVPYALLALYAFRTSLRLKMSVTMVIFGFSVFLEALLLLIGNNSSDPTPLICTYANTFLCIILYLRAVKARWGRKLFNLLMIKNMANCNTVIAKGIEGIFFPDLAVVPYRWSNSFCLLLILIIEIPIMMWVLDHYFSEDVRNTIGPELWSKLWIVPLFFMLLWVDRFYYSETGSLTLALNPKMILVMLMYFAGQLLIYICIAQLVINYHKSAFLQKENEQLAKQTIQYQYISSRIQEVTALRHDMRHTLVLMKGYCESGQYDKLNSYLSQYVTMFPHESINYCGNITLNVLLVYYQGICLKNKIRYTVQLHLPDLLPLSDTEITVLFGNILENAVDACMDMQDQSGEITVHASFIQEQLIFHVSNTYQNAISFDSYGNLLSTKHEGIGIGTESIRSIIEAHHGSYQITYENGMYILDFTIPYR